MIFTAEADLNEECRPAWDFAGLGSLGCSPAASQEPVTLSFLDIEYDAPDRLPGLSDDLQAFVQETGIRVTRLPRRKGSLNQFAMWKTLLQRAPLALMVRAWRHLVRQYTTSIFWI